MTNEKPVRYHLFGIFPIGPSWPSGDDYLKVDLRWPWRWIGWHR